MKLVRFKVSAQPKVGRFFYLPSISAKIGLMTIAPTIVDKAGLKTAIETLLTTIAVNENGATIIHLKGNLGAGKTTLTQMVGDWLGVTEPIVSPTYVILKKYQLGTDQRWQRLVHLDLYRLNNEDEAKILKLEELLSDPKNLVVIEWPENLPTLAGKPSLTINLAFINDTERELTIAYGA